MSHSYSVTDTTTFTHTHAVHIAAKVATDLKRIQRLYDEPPDERIVKLHNEAIALLKGGYLDTVTYGFQRNGRWIEPTLHYAASDIADDTAIDDDPGRIRPGASVDGASFHSYLIYSAAWDQLSLEQQDEFYKQLHFKRSYGSEPDASGRWVRDRTYSAGNRALYRNSLRTGPR